MDFLQFGLARVGAAEACLAPGVLVSFSALTAVALAGASAIAHCVVQGPAALLRHLALTGGALVAAIALTFTTVALALPYKW